MLKLKRVDIQGFKSFYDRTEMRFHGSGVAAIVGPNGCGKSNLSDAISWVLGEQSAKSLRGARMEDVIFAGTRERKPLGMAQVTLTMSDPEAHREHKLLEAGVLNGTHGTNGTSGTNGHHAHGNGHQKPADITITRRLYRSGESEYLIDGKTARLRDIQDLFMGTGLGPESYAIIEQGRIGQILSNKPADRRAIIEEAAGIGKYKNRKRLAESKLESAKQNLARVFDILEEVGRQANSLKRQASKAKRYEELRAEMLNHLRHAVAGRFRLLESEAAKLALDLGQAQTNFQTLTAEVQTKEQEYTRTQESCYQVEAALTSARGRVAELNLESERTRSRVELQARQIGALEERMAAGETETRELDERHQRESTEIAAHQESIAGMERDVQDARQQLDAKARERDALQIHLREREQSLEAARQAVLRLLNEASGLRNQLAQADEYLASMERDAARARKEEECSTADLARLEQSKSELSTRLSARQLELESLTGRRRRVEDELKQRRERVIESRQALNGLRDLLSKQKARKESLEGILSHRAYTTESVKHLFQQQPEGFRPLGVLADFVEVTNPDWERACEEFLHEELEYVVVDGWNDAERGVEVLRAESDGRATFLVHSATDTATRIPDLSSEPSVAGALRDAVRLTNGFSAAPQGFLSRLAHCFLVHDRAAAPRLAEAHPDCYFLLPDGASYHGHTVTGGKKSSGGPLALKRELRELTAQVEVRDREADERTAALEELERSAALLAEELEQVRGLQQTQEKDALAMDHEQRKLAEEYARAGSRLSAARLELERLARQDQQARAQREINQTLVAEKEQARFDQEKTVEVARGEFDGLQAQVHAIGEAYSVLRAGLAGLEERARAEKTAAGRLEAQIQQLTARREQLARDLERMGVERAHLLTDNIELDQRAQQLHEHTAEATGRVELLTAQEAGGREALAALDEALKTLRGDAQAAQEQRSRIELELVRKQAELKYLDETSHKELSAGAQEIAALLESARTENHAAAVKAMGVEESEQRYQEVRARIEALGPVNPQALEEYQEAQQRYEFLNTQRQDLLDSIRDTEKAIQELDTESRKRFQEAFENINTNFKEMFQTLFGGGVGEMRLTDESNLAESGIDIMASPPGKRLQHIALLSGGEKSLTAMALLMAIFRYTPSPFCILDEVDAPLDEPNIQRLTRLLKEMSHDTQFIVITHAKRTMEAAQSLYGVTMQEPGVSKLVSVKFDPLPVAAAPPAMATAMAAV
ncbi:MAG: chromosome segregation protein SMC [Bryobacterales bacterium]|nr:chromosome segregation protein SMC [Bryobacterales bacterium]